MPGQARVHGLGGVHHDDLAGQVWAGLADLLLGTQLVGASALDARGEPGEGLQRGRAAGAVGRHPDVALELTHALLGLAAEDAVVATDVEAEAEQTLLQGEHVVAAQLVARDVGEQPVAQAPACLVEGAVGQRPHQTVHGQPSLLLEGTDRPVERGVEDRSPRGVDAWTLACVEQPHPGQQGADVRHRLPLVADAVERAHGAPLGRGLGVTTWVRPGECPPSSQRSKEGAGPGSERSAPSRGAVMLSR